MSPTRKKRIQLDFTIPEANALDDTVRRTGHRSRAEVIRRSLRLYRMVVDAIRQGQILAFQDRDGNVHPVQFLP